jgi:hypothetical protein
MKRYQKTEPNEHVDDCPHAQVPHLARSIFDDPLVAENCEMSIAPDDHLWYFAATMANNYGVTQLVEERDWNERHIVKEDCQQRMNPGSARRSINEAAPVDNEKDHAGDECGERDDGKPSRCENWDESRERVRELRRIKDAVIATGFLRAFKQALFSEEGGGALHLAGRYSDFQRLSDFISELVHAEALAQLKKGPEFALDDSR